MGDHEPRPDVVRESQVTYQAIESGYLDVVLRYLERWFDMMTLGEVVQDLEGKRSPPVLAKRLAPRGNMGNVGSARQGLITSITKG
jgi:hypothetical protein